MRLKWTDSRDIAIELIDKYPSLDPQSVRFTELRDYVMQLDSFDDDPKHVNERILEAIITCWQDEM